VELTSENAEMLWIPEGFGHAFLVLSDVAGFAYKVTDYYSAAAERTILWNDPELAIPWPVSPDEVIVSAKDRLGITSKDADVFP
jgi:dTDP-4-dehydrorhamnose 3,5-epimerase